MSQWFPQSEDPDVWPRTILTTSVVMKVGRAIGFATGTVPSVRSDCETPLFCLGEAPKLD
jgi:hypothetical protein